MSGNEVLSQTLSYSTKQLAKEKLHPHIKCEETVLGRSYICPNSLATTGQSQRCITISLFSPKSLHFSLYISLNNVNSASLSEIIKYEVIRIMMPIMVINNNKKRY